MPDFLSKALAKSTAIIRLLSPNGGKKSQMKWSLYDTRGRRKYLVPKERWAFLAEALRIGGKAGTFCVTLLFTGARLCEVLSLTPEQIDEPNGAINIETLKRRERGIIRAVPVPRRLFALLDKVHGFRLAKDDTKCARKRLWTFSDTTGWRRVREVMRAANVPSHLWKPKALRHAFGAAATLQNVSLTLVQKWMGHARVETTMIYTSLIGKEERSLARSTWRGSAREFRW
jgi:integrase/recombinase XerD